MKSLLEILALILVLIGNASLFLLGPLSPFFVGPFILGFVLAAIAQTLREPGRDDWDPWRWVFKE